jgi:hypothetical protein
MNTTKRLPSLFYLLTIIFFSVVFNSNAQPPMGTVAFERGTHLGGSLETAAVSGDYAFIAEGVELHVFNLSTNPYESVAWFSPPGPVQEIFILDSYAYLYTGANDSNFCVLDITDPVHPVLVSSIQVPATWGASMHGSTGYVCIAMRDSMLVVDVTNPALPVVAASVKINAIQVYTGPRYAFVAGDSGLAILDMTKLAQPKLVSFTEIPRACTVTARQGMVYVGQQDWKSMNYGVQIVDATDRSHPVKKGFIRTAIVDGHTTYLKNPSHIVLNKDYAYVGTMGGPNIFIIDVSDPDHPLEAGRFDLSDKENSSVENMQIVASFLYVTSRNELEGFYQLKLKDPIQPQISSQLEQPSFIWHIAVVSDTLYMASSERLWIYKFIDPRQPVLLGSSQDYADMRRIAIRGHILYGILNNKFFLLDVIDPQNIKQIGVYECPDGEIYRFALQGDHAFLFTLAQSPCHMIVLDLTDPAQPASVCNQETGVKILDVTVAEKDTVMYVIYANEGLDNGLMSFSVADPANPKLLDSVQTQGLPVSMAVSDTSAVVSSVVIPVRSSSRRIVTEKVEEIRSGNMVARLPKAEYDTRQFVNEGPAPSFFEKFNISDPKNMSQQQSLSMPSPAFTMFLIQGFLFAYMYNDGFYAYLFLNLLKIYNWDAYEALFFYFICYDWDDDEDDYYAGLIYNSGYYYSESGSSYPYIYPNNGLYSQYIRYTLPVNNIKIEPPTASIRVGQQVQFTAKGYDSNGHLLTTFPPNPMVDYGPIQWSSNGGTITDEGLFTPDKPGDYTITVSHSSGSATATVHVDPPAAVDERTTIVKEYRLEQNHPNPFNPTTTLSYSVKEKAHVKLELYDITGRIISTLVDEEQNAGVYQIPFDGSVLASGVYFYRISMNGFTAVKKMVLLE